MTRYSNFTSMVNYLMETRRPDRWDFDDEQENRKHLPRLSELYYNHLENPVSEWAEIAESRRSR